MKKERTETRKPTKAMIFARRLLIVWAATVSKANIAKELGCAENSVRNWLTEPPVAILKSGKIRYFYPNHSNASRKIIEKRAPNRLEEFFPKKKETQLPLQETKTMPKGYYYLKGMSDGLIERLDEIEKKVDAISERIIGLYRVLRAKGIID